MPRISAATIAEHVAQQEAAVVAAARRLFVARGVTAVSLADIAAEVGLRRTSLYRYFPTKAHILQRWFDLEMTPLVQRSAQLADADRPAVERLAAWLDLQLDFVTEESHAVLVAASALELPEEVLADFVDRHRELYATLTPMLAEGGAVDAEAARTRAMLIAGLLRSAGDLVRQGVPIETVRAELVRSATAVAGL